MGLLITALANFKGTITDENNQPITDENNQAIIFDNKAKATTLATLIKEFFVINGEGIQFTKGKNIYRYTDPVNGYRLMIYAHLESDALPIIEKMLECTETVYDQNKLSTHEPLRDNTITPPEQLVYEKEIIPPKFRPNANVRFRYAYLEIPLVKKPIYLVDTTHRHIPLVH